MPECTEFFLQKTWWTHNLQAERFWFFLLTGVLLLYPFIVRPLYFGAAWVNPEEVWILPRILLLLFVGILGLLQAQRGMAAYRSPFVILLLVYLASVIPSSLNAQDDDASSVILGGRGRLDGLLYQVGLVLFGIFAYRVLRQETSSANAGTSSTAIIALRVMVLGGSLEAAILMAQKLGAEFIGPLVRGVPYEAPVGTIGHPGMAAGFLLPLVFVGLGMWLLTEERKRAWLLLQVLLIAAGLGVTTNKASLLALIGILLIWNLIQRQPRLLWASSLVLLSFFAAKELLPNRLGFDRSYADLTTGQTRIIIWKLAWEATRTIPGWPVLGGGPDAFRLALIRHIPIEHLLEEYRLEYGWPPQARVKEIKPLWRANDPLRSRSFLVEFENWTGSGKAAKILMYFLDKAHNLILDRLLAFGLLGALVWLGLYLYPVLRGWRGRLLQRSLAMGLLAIFIYYLFWFPVPQVEPLHLVLIAAAWALLGQKPTPPEGVA
ncbi:hypothetical protein Mesil_0887 [Allomeiothermus silvanus DSM 9946]|uniref:O-antigen polymerase n=1 Tax=Allomeiothermus silvanus (strain ATCC 700542 / DSM 9946 / NBRC 106475 / NCIMB 13440 / VI-R2) TaxID=526227 RepID=D7BC03_ALLS1|nr:hypothetical protein [Allomeiothermus silvanus]ADH62799.1 hypothetical protein Mesil_0887 [Allomeiothermus silvanus DSM 9946]